jgi:1-acyl-sn-glycerol-3-phosphate acyltransferase
MRWRVSLVLAVLAQVTPPMMAVQALALKYDWRIAHKMPLWFHRLVLKLLRVRVHIEGTPAPDRPLLLVSNHLSWLDIVVIGAAFPVSFIAKAEVGTWPVIGTFARMQRSVFIDRTRRTATRDAHAQVAKRLAQGDPLVLFAEGTTSDGYRVLPFRSALIGAATSVATEEGAARVQPLIVAYPGRAGAVSPLPGPDLAWHGDMDLLPHLNDVITGPPIRAVLRFGEPVAITPEVDRKALARDLEAEIARTYDTLRAGLA